MSTYCDADKKIMYNSFLSRNKSRLQELLDYARVSGFNKIGVANCKGVQPYADKLIEILKKEGFEVFSISCKDSGLNGSCICEEMTGPCCDPLSQAIYLNEQNTDLNINVGLCLGHGIIFSKHSKAPVTTFLVKDFATQHCSVENLK